LEYKIKSWRVLWLVGCPVLGIFLTLQLADSIASHYWRAAVGLFLGGSVGILGLLRGRDVFATKAVAMSAVSLLVLSMLITFFASGKGSIGTVVLALSIGAAVYWALTK
jgi:hypothetical protein